MALIKCPECGKEVSSRAKSCPNCGCPIEDISPIGTVRIKLPNLELGTMGLFSSRAASVKTPYGEILWKGEHGQVAKFEIDGETEITIDLGRWANPLTATVYPHKKYAMVQDMGVHMFATYRLSEVDVIDAE